LAVNVAFGSELDSGMLNRTASPGSLRYFALLYAPPERRDAIAALFVIDSELRESARNANHDVAHTRLQWWRAEIDRLANRNSQHPATRLLQAQQDANRAAFAKLHELVAAADMDLARMTYNNAQELRAYCARSAGALMETIASQLAPTAMDPTTSSLINRVGTGIREVEIVRDLRQDAHEGRVYLAVEEMDRLNIRQEDLDRPQTSEPVRAALESVKRNALENLTKPEIKSAELHDALRPIWVLAALHRRLIERIAKQNYNVGAERTDLGPIEKPWVAWRAARARR
jgi:15-cis-phytoene synthase